MQTLTTTSGINLRTGNGFVINHAGAGGLLFDAARGKYQSDIQNRIWLLAVMMEEQKAHLHIREVITGVNNLLITFDPLGMTPLQAEEALIRQWNKTRGETLQGRDVALPVIYGGEARADLTQMSKETGLSIDHIIGLHSAAVYTVACLGSMPGFAYMTGLPPELARPRLASPYGHSKRFSDYWWRTNGCDALHCPFRLASVR
nr:carboxyltransferase domain-containing protein [Pantoea bituminis]